MSWIKLHRKIRRNPLYRNSKALHIWIECLLRASHTDSGFYRGRTFVKLTSGQFVMGRNEFALSVGLSGSTVWYWLRQFYLDNMIDMSITRGKGTIITVIGWSKYQHIDNQVDIKKTYDEHEKNIYKNVEEGKKNVEEIDRSGKPNPFSTFIEQFNHLFSPARKFKGNDKVRRNFNARIREGYTVEDILKSTQNALLDDFHIENEYRYITPEFMTRADKLERFLHSVPQANREDIEANKRKTFEDSLSKVLF